MSIKIKRKFEAEYGKAQGDRIFYAWENKHGMLRQNERRENKMRIRHHHSNRIMQEGRQQEVRVKKFFAKSGIRLRKARI